MKKDLRYYVRLAKAAKKCNYKNIASYLGISNSAMYNWLNCQYELSSTKQRDLNELLNKLLNRSDV